MMIQSRKARVEMVLKINEVDFNFILGRLGRAKVVFESLGQSNEICEANRQRYREDAKMMISARDMMYAAKSDGEGDVN